MRSIIDGKWIMDPSGQNELHMTQYNMRLRDCWVRIIISVQIVKIG